MNLILPVSRSCLDHRPFHPIQKVLLERISCFFIYVEHRRPQFLYDESSELNLY